jgi:hypothetical protein
LSLLTEPAVNLMACLLNADMRGDVIVIVVMCQA